MAERAENIGQVLDNPFIAQLDRRNVQGHEQTVRPFAGILTSLAEDRTGEWVDQPRILRNGNKLFRRDVSKFGVAPAGEDLISFHAAIAEPDKRLVIRLDLVVIDRAAQIHFKP